MVLFVLEVLLVGGIRRRGELLDGLIRQNLVQKVGEHAGDRAGDHACVAVVVGSFAKPQRHGVLGRDAAEVAVLLVVGSTRFASSLLAVGQTRRRTRAIRARDDALHDLDGGMRNLSRENALARRVGIVHDDVAT